MVLNLITLRACARGKVGLSVCHRSCYHCPQKIGNSRDVARPMASSVVKITLLLNAKQGPQTLEIVLFVWPHSLATPSTALCIHTA